MKSGIIVFSLTLSLPTLVEAADLIELRHNDLETRDSYKVIYWCLEPGAVPASYAAPTYEVSEGPISGDIIGPTLRREAKAAIFLTTQECLDQAMPNISMFVGGIESFSVSPASP